jgi:peroxiredoxin
MLKKIIGSLFGLILLVLLASAVPQGDSVLLGAAIAPFQLRSVNTSDFQLGKDSAVRGVVVVFTCNHCPMAKLYTQRLNEMTLEFAKQNVAMVAINSMDTLVYEEENFLAMRTKAQLQQYTFPYLYDNEQTVARLFGAEKTPQAFVLWKENDQWIVRYKGAIDSNGEHAEEAIPYVRDAINSLLSGVLPKNPETLSFGCRIYLRNN